MGFLTNGIPLWGEHRLLLTTNSYDLGKEKDGTAKVPTKISTIATMILFIGFVSLCQKLTLLILASLKGYHPILEDETNCEVLARNLGMCTMCTATMTILGYKHRATYSELTAKFFGSKDAMKPAGFERRLQKYHPGGQQCALLFCAYQCKNTYECFQHIEEPINLLHHSVSAFIAWLSLHPGGIHFYVVASSFCEIPAMISSIYINFDDGFLLGSIPGLGAAFPKTKFVFSIASGISFILFRVCFWFFLMFHYVLDMRRAMNSKRPSAQKFKFWLPAFLLCAIILFYVNVILFTTVIRYIPKVLGNLLKERI